MQSNIVLKNSLKIFKERVFTDNLIENNCLLRKRLLNITAYYV